MAGRGPLKFLRLKIYLMVRRAATACRAAMDIRQQFGSILRGHRTGRNLTQEELAFRAGMSVPYLSDIERGRSAPSLAMLIDLALALEIHPADLLRGLDMADVARDGGRKRPKDGI